MSEPTLKVTSDWTKEFSAVIGRFKSDAVLVGIPQDDKERKKEEGNTDEPITNAAILAINHFGSEGAGIPPRPVMSIGIKNAQEDIAEEFKKCAKDALSKGIPAIEKYYNRAGIIASNAVKQVITTNEGIQAPAAATLEARKYLTKSGFKGTKALLVTAQMRNAITYFVKSIWGR